MKFLSSCANSFSIISESADDTFLAGRALGESLYPGLLILLKGELGMGKTRFTQGIGRALGYDRVKSPTFVIMNEYDADVPFLHADLYRLEDEDEIESLGIEEYLDDASPPPSNGRKDGASAPRRGSKSNCCRPQATRRRGRSFLRPRKTRGGAARRDKRKIIPRRG